MHTLVILVALVLCLAVVLVAVEGGLVAWVLRGCPDYLDENARAEAERLYDLSAEMLQNHREAIVEVEVGAWPAGRDLNAGWPRDTGTKPR